MANQAETGGDAPSSPPMAQELNSATIGAIIGVAAAMLAVLITLIWILIRQRQQHQRRMADLEQRADMIRDRQSRLPQVAQMEGVPISRPRNVLRRTTFLPFGTRVGWDTLESREDVSRQQHHDANMPTSVYTRPVREKKRNSKRLSWPFSRQPVLPNVVPLEDMGQTRLSTVPESPAAASLQSHPATREVNDALRASTSSVHQAAGHRNRTIRRIDSVSELRPDPLIVGKKRARAQTLANASALATPRTEPSKVAKRPRPAMHVRSFSLGSQSPGSAPQHAVPPLPLTVRNVEIASRPKSCYSGNPTSRVSISSLESIGSSLLASPRLQRSASERSARLQHVARRDYANSLISGPRPQRPKVNKRPQSSPEHNLYMQSLRGSIKSNVDSMQSEGQRPLSAITITSEADVLSIPSVRTAEAVRLSRISLVPVGTPYQSNSTPRRQSRITVSENGSPAQRVRSVALREIAGNARLSQQLSQASTDASSTRSSNGNPFQFDPSPMASGKASALKGSPTSKGPKHRRSTVVRINISPQIINPKRGSSPLMADIQEESPETMAKVPQFSSSMGPLPQPPSSPRPPSTSTFDPQIKVRPSSFVASLTADSPTLSSMNFMQDYKRSSMTSSNGDSNANPLSFSSIFIPSFPSPGKAAVTTNVMPTPTFSYTRPSNEIERESPSTEAMMLLARPYSPREPDVLKLSTSSASSSVRKVSKGSTTGELIFPTLEKEQLRAPQPPFHELSLDNANLASSPADSPEASPSPNPSPSFAPQNWLHESSTANTQPPLSPPLSPKSSPIVIYQGREEDAISIEMSSENDEQDVKLPLHSPSPIPGLNIYSSPLLPSSQVEPPATDLCLSIAELRRMNSDAKYDAQNPKLKAARRYQRMGRGESPRVVSRDSVESLCEIDEALDFGLGPSEDTADEDSIIYGDSPRDDAEKENLPTVWDDGEDYWKPRPKPTRAIASSPLLPSSRDVSPLLASSVQNRDNKGIQSPLVHRRVSEMRGSAILEKLPVALNGIAGPGTPKVIVQPPSSDIGSPASSLYDAFGFLR